jgi:rfaE bifunctional protein nucleotidyltransferase chain/domain
LAANLIPRWDVRAVAVTLGARGAVVRHRHGACAAAPAPAVAEGDPCGAGDHFAGGVAALLAGGATVDEAVAGAVAGAAEFVARGGGGAVRRVGDAWGQPCGKGSARTGDPVTDLAAARALVDRVRAGGGTVVATGGLFGRLHAGHAETLAAARALGDCLLVLVNSDVSARRRTGPPATPLNERVAALAALGGVDGVVAFDGDDPRAVLDVLRPDLWVKGGDHDPADLPETPLVRSWGGEVIAVPYRGNVPDVVDNAPRLSLARWESLP